MTQCLNCKIEFPHEPADLELLERLSPCIDGIELGLPPPKLCPDCRMQRRMLWRGELNWYRRKSDRSGKPIISYLPESAPCKVYSVEEWWADDWDAEEYGREYDFSRPFFDQFAELISVVPVPALNNYQNENCEYINCAATCRNCYLLGGTNYSEDCYYGNYVNHSKCCVDNNFISQCELCYECVDCKSCYETKYAQNCDNCSLSAFLLNCRSCKNCFCCCNLNQREYCFFNRQLSPEDYREKVGALHLERRENAERIELEFEKFCAGFPRRYMIGVQNENVAGSAVNNSRNSANCFDASKIEDCRHCTWLHSAKSCMDIFSWGMAAELCYECTEVGGDSYQVAFSATTWGSSRLLYCYLSRQCQDCFGCMGLSRKSHCILNRRYSPEDYNKTVLRIVEQMKKNGEWGEFFPPRLSPQPYNSAVTQDYFPLDRAGIERLGARWEPAVENVSASGAGPLTPVPQTAAEIAGPGIYKCSASGRPFKITAQELDFYSRLSLPPPAVSFQERHRRRLGRRNPRRLWSRECDRCRKPIQTSYSPDRPEKIFCEDCYRQEVN